MSIKIPQQGKFAQPNNSDLFGNLHYTKSVNLDEEGYIKLSPRAVSLISEADDTNFDVPVALGRKGTGDFYVATIDRPYNVSLSTSISVSEDTDSDDQNPPQGSVDTSGRWWQNKWHVAGTSGGTLSIFYKTPSNGNWSTTSISGISSGSMHAIEVFQSRNSVCVSDGVAVRQYSSGYSTTNPETSTAYPILYVPQGLEINDIAFSNGKMGIATRLSDDVSGQNLEAQFFVWDGQQNTANGAYPAGSDSIIGIKAYKNTWAILTRNGLLRQFNGGGFTDLAALPFWFSNRVWGNATGDILAFRDFMQVDGDIIYINLDSMLTNYGIYGEDYKDNNIGGIICYDPKVGITHKYAPSISNASTISAAQANVNTTTNTITKSSGTIPETGNPIKYVPGASTVIGGLQPNKVYYVIKVDASNFKLATSRANAEDGTAVDLTSTGASINYFIALNVLDYGISRTNRAGALAMHDRSTANYDHLIWGGEYIDYDSNTSYAHLNTIIPGFKNIGYFVTPKDVSDVVTENTQRVFVKYRPLDTGDTIKIKYKTHDALNLPISTPHTDSSTCTWSNTTTFTTTANLSAVKTYLDANTGRECEVELISGAGAGQMSKISSITELNGTYTVILSDEIEGVAQNYKSDVKIDNWKTLGTITSSDDLGWKQFNIGEKSKWFKYKVIMSGTDIAIEEFSTSTNNFKNS